MVRTSAIVCCALAFVYVQKSSARKVIQTKMYTASDCNDASEISVFNEFICKVANSETTVASCDATEAKFLTYDLKAGNECPTGGTTINEVKHKVNECLIYKAKFMRISCIDVDEDNIESYTVYGDDCSKAPKSKEVKVVDKSCFAAGGNTWAKYAVSGSQSVINFYSQDDCSGTIQGATTYDCGDVCHLPSFSGVATKGTEKKKYSIGGCSAPAGANPAPGAGDAAGDAAGDGAGDGAGDAVKEGEGDSNFSTKISNSIPLVAILVFFVTGVPKLI